jgi:hypothetical protein
MGRKKNAAWATFRCELVTKDKEDGDGKIEGWKCPHCLQSIWNRCIDRMLVHIAQSPVLPLHAQCSEKVPKVCRQPAKAFCFRKTRLENLLEFFFSLLVPRTKGKMPLRRLMLVRNRRRRSEEQTKSTRRPLPLRTTTELPASS